LEEKQRKEDITEFPINSIVLARYPDRGLGHKAPTKVHPKWEGPFRVVNIHMDGNRYSLQNFLDGSIHDRHITDLKLFHYNENETTMSLEDIALRDRISEFPVERVLYHRIKEGKTGKRINSSDLEFHIQWKGFNEDWNTWEPFKNVRLNKVVIEYLRANNLKRFIPRNIKEHEENQYINTMFSKKRVTFNNDIEFITSQWRRVTNEYGWGWRLNHSSNNSENISIIESK
jgi:hypothetical protein